MKRFSERQGLTKARTEIQIDSMDEALRNRLWNLLTAFYWDKGCARSKFPYVGMTDNMDIFIRNLWHLYFKQPFDTLSNVWSQVLQTLRNWYFKLEWYMIYDFVEFVAAYYPDEGINAQFMQACNSVLESDLSAYRFVGKQITPITSKEEIAEVNEALGTPFGTVNAHLESALKLMSDRKSPDYRNSIKESISAVEGICRLITKNDNATLGQALKEVETKTGLHKALKNAFSSLYGYTSSANGIRHALLDEATLSFEDAKFMLVSCSAFVNYLISKASKAGLDIELAKK